MNDINISKKSNGRVDLTMNSCFTHSDRIPAKTPASFRTALTGNWCDTKLSVLFFSQENQKILQNGIRAGVYKKSKNLFKIGEQNYDELKIIMRSIFLQYSKNDKKNITEQIKELNDLVLDYSINQIYGEAKSYVQYIHDASTLVTPLSRPITDNNNDKELIFKPRY